MNNFEQSNYIIVNGIKMTLAEFKKSISNVRRAEKKAKRENYLKEIATYCNTLVKEFKLPKSLCVYYSNGYKQWGLIAKTIINNSIIASPFAKVVITCNNINIQLEDLSTLGKKSDKAIFGYVERLGYLVDDLANGVDELSNAISESGVLYQYRNHECINGTGKRLGLKILVQRTCEAIMKMRLAYDEFDRISKNGLDISNYSHNGARVVR